MLTFCENIENNPKFREFYHKKMNQLAKWYTESVTAYEGILKTELGMSQMARVLRESTVCKDLLEDLTEDLTYNFNAKLSYFCVSDALVKLILSKYSFGPTIPFLKEHELTFRPQFSDRCEQSWLNCKASEPVMAEIAAKVLKQETGGVPIDFQALASDREVRSKLAHASNTDICLSAMRCYHVIQSMFVFLDPEYRNTLPMFSFDEMFHYDQFQADPCFFDFDHCTTILIADSVHDVRSDYRGAVANLPWNLVIDLDGYSDAGGLLSTVSHNCILKQVLYRAKADSLSQLSPDKTLWYRCGEYQSFGFEPSDEFSIAPYIHFHKDRAGNSTVNNLKIILEQLLLLAKSQDRMINLVAVTDNAFLIKHLISVITSRRVALDNYFLSWVGLTGEESRIFDWYDGDQEQMDQHFRHHQCPTYQFYRAFAEYGSDWTPRVSLKSHFTLPGTDGSVVVREVERNNLEGCFEVLYDNCEQETEDRAEEMRLSFYQGNSASWNVIAAEHAPLLRKPVEFDRMKQLVRTLLGRIQPIPQKRLYFIQHKAGIGGTTLARQLAWDLHMEFAVLSVRNYSSEIKTRIEHLYDVVLNRAPIIILAEDTLPNFDRLCADICRLDRRCILIAACRDSNTAIKETYPQANYEPFNSIPKKRVSLLQSRYHSVSPLPKDELAQKDRAFPETIVGQMVTPFIIGLYYMDREFSIDAYVHKALAECTDRSYANMMACIAVCDRYDRKSIPVSFVNKALNLRQQSGFLRTVPAAASLISIERQSSNIDCYHFKHPLLSERFLTLYCEKYYGGAGNLQNALYDCTLSLIDNMAAMGNHLQETHLDILIFILIQNKREDAVNPYLSALMLDIAMPENQKILMRRLAERFKPLADGIREEELHGDRILDRKDRQILRLVSHAYAHLGRMYSKMDRNYEKAHEEFHHAIHYMPDDDPNIYHMAGSALLDKLKSIWDEHQTGPIAPEVSSEIRLDVEMACKYFDSASDFGSAEYGYPSKLELLYHYLRFIFRISEIHSAEDIPSQDVYLRQLQTDFMNTLEEAKAYPDFDETAKDRIEDFEGRFQSNIMFGNFSQAIGFYQNQVDRLKGTNDIGGLNNSLRGLVFARIQAARAEFPDMPFYRGVKNPMALMENIETLLNQPPDPGRYSDYTTRTQFFHYWMQLAKVLNRPIESGLAMARRWMELEERNKQNKNPEPYYYKKVLLYLSAHDGSSRNLEELHKLNSEISRLDSNSMFDTRRGSLIRTRDVFVTGSEMGQLFDVRYCRAEEDILSALAEANRKPAVISGNFTSTQYIYALLEVYQPAHWSGETAWMDIGKNAQSPFTAAQKGDKLAFIMGFSVERPIALSRYAADLSQGEVLDVDRYLREAKKAKSDAGDETGKAPREARASSRPSGGLSRKNAAVPPRTQEERQREEPSHEPALTGKVVKVLLDSVGPSSASGHFENDGERYTIEIKLKNKHAGRRAENARKQRMAIKVRITGQPKNNIFPGQCVD